MIPFLIGLGATAAIILFAEIFRKIDLKLYASLNLVAIPFIYVGFSISLQSLVFTVPTALFFVVLAYLGYKKSYLFTVVGLVLHGLWDILFPYVSTVAPPGYDVFCITIDVLAAAYFYFKIKKLEDANAHTTGPKRVSIAES
jgi:hypothetical protein